MDLSQLADKTIALVVWGEDNNGKEEVVVYSGKMRLEGNSLFFHRKDKEVHFEMPFDDLNRIKPVPSDLSDILLNCEYYVNLSIVPTPEDENPDDFTNTGLKWPE